MIIRINILFTFSLLLISCRAKNVIKLNDERINETGGTEQPLDTLAAYRKMPGKPKTVHVDGYYRKDSTYVKEHWRTEKE
ncbi:hypothetical protein ACLI1A_10085 [Flavobacterium sp. RHBU_3]|uniref:hypothetical protein n=1 Tax=Flavobacterium sp. RHBU_3 TaxID=3391184 RepID=UPI003984BFF9